jgi:hypothetical protein
VNWQNIKVKGLAVAAWLWANKIEAGALTAVFLFGKWVG